MILHIVKEVSNTVQQYWTAQFHIIENCKLDGTKELAGTKL